MAPRFPGPALVDDAAGGLTAANEHAATLAAAIEDGALPALAKAIAGVAESRAAGREKIEIPTAEGHQTLDLVLLCLGEDGERVLVLGRDATVEHNLINALVASRQLFKDVVGCTSDFAWETREDGTFGFVSPRGAIGYHAHELNRRHPRTLLHGDHEPPDVLPFASQRKLIDEEVWLTRADGSAACLLTSCVPVFNEIGHWMGARGLCRDVTESRERDAALSALRTRDMLLGKIVDSIRNELDPKRMLGVAADSAAQSLDAAYCWILRADHGGALTLEVAHEGRAGAPPEAVVAAALAALGSDDDSVVVDLDAGELAVLIARARYHGIQNGAICLARGREEAPWEASDRALAAGVGNHLGIAIAQIADHEALERLSRTDELTGLVNRRAFYDVVAARLNHLRRMKRPGALLYVDLDNFKPVNDVHGATPRATWCSRSWRGCSTRTATRAMCRRASEAMSLRCGWRRPTRPRRSPRPRACCPQAPSVRPFSGAADKPLGISIGIAISDPVAEPEDLKALIARADQAMYRAKRAGKGGYVLMRPTESAGTDGAVSMEEI